MSEKHIKPFVIAQGHVSAALNAIRKAGIRAEGKYGQLWFVLGFNKFDEEYIKALLIKFIADWIGRNTDGDILLMMFRLLQGYKDMDSVGERYEFFVRPENSNFLMDFYLEQYKQYFDCDDDQERAIIIKKAADNLRKTKEKALIKQLAEHIVRNRNSPDFEDVKNYYDKTEHAILPEPSCFAQKDKKESQEIAENGIRSTSRIRTVVRHPKKKMPVVGIILTIGATLLTAVVTQGGNNIADQVFGTPTIKLETEFDRHLLLKLDIDYDNAVHQYNMGLNNWKRLDYQRASRDISNALNEISQQRAQATIEIAKIKNSLGCLYLDMGKYEEANDFLNSAFITFREALGPDSLEARAARFGISRYDYYTGNHEQALREAQEIIDKSDREKEQAVIASIEHFRANVFDSLGKYDEALAVYQSVLTLYEGFQEDEKLSEELAKYTTDSSVDEYTLNYRRTAIKWIILTYNNIGAVNIHIGDYINAEANLKTALKESLSPDNMFIGEKNLNTAIIYQNLASTVLLAGDTKNATTYIERAIAIQRSLFNYTDEYPGLAESFRVFADIRITEGDAQEALEYYERALKQSESKYGEYHSQTAVSCTSLAKYYMNQGDYEVAKNFLERALDIYTNTGSYLNRSDAIVKLWIDFSLVYLKLGQKVKTESSLQNAENLCNELFDTGNILKARNYASIASVYLESMNFGKAARFAIDAYIVLEQNREYVSGDDLTVLLKRIYAGLNIREPFADWIQSAKEAAA